MSSLAVTDRPEAPLFSDGIGDRVVAADGATGELLQILRLRPALTAVPSFEFALRERAARLANFRHAYYVRVRRVDRALNPASALAIVSDHLEGTRLSDILRVAHDKGLQLDINAALCLIRQLVPAVAVLHENARDVAHGLIAPERLVVTPNARLVIVEHVLGAAIEQLQYGRDRLWQEFRVAMPPSAGLPRFDHRADVIGMGLVALSLVIGRPLGADEFPHQIPALLNGARERTALGDEQPLSPGLRGWLGRALQLDVRHGFASAPEAMAALDEVVADDSMYVAAPVALETFMSRYIASLLEPDPVRRIEFAPPAAVPVDTRQWQDPPVVKPAAPAPVMRSVPPAPERAPMPPVAFVSEPVAPVAFEAEPVAPPVNFASDPAPLPRSVVDITDLLGPDPLPIEPLTQPAIPAVDRKPLFDPDAPFTAAADLPAESASSSGGRSWLRTAAIPVLVGLAVLGGAGYFGLKAYRKPAGAPAMGALAVQSNPVGASVVVDGVERGVTPARLSLPPGAHILELRGRGVPRVIPFTITAGAEVSQYLEFAEAPVTGQLAVQSEPAGAKVLVDGIERGVAPLTIPDLAAGNHEVVLQAEGATARHTVIVQADGTASLVIPLGAAAATGPQSGWFALKAPFTIEIREQGRLLGTTEADRIMMPAGRHELELVNEAVGYKVTRVIQVPAGKLTSLSVELPQGVINLNASPWAEVWIDGQRVGETPIGNLALSIGPHEVVFKHPQFGEKRHAVSVTLNAPVRLSVDMK